MHYVKGLFILFFLWKGDSRYIYIQYIVHQPLLFTPLTLSSLYSNISYIRYTHPTLSYTTIYLSIYLSSHYIHIFFIDWPSMSVKSCLFYYILFVYTMYSSVFLLFFKHLNHPNKIKMVFYRHICLSHTNLLKPVLCLIMCCFWTIIIYLFILIYWMGHCHEIFFSQFF